MTEPCSDDELMTIFAKEMERPVSEEHPRAGEMHVSPVNWKDGVSRFYAQYGRTPLITQPPGPPSFSVRAAMKEFFERRGWITSSFSAGGS